ncbi:MAG: O-antigen ligase family protein [Armatimonadetes bacterium]|nr:O-antigen ligase family protein [Armatimonadota bacterium]
MAVSKPFGGKFDQERKPFDKSALAEGAKLSVLQSSRGLLYWNVMSIIFVTVPLFLPVSDILAQLLRYLMFNAVACATFTWWRLGVPLKLVWPVRFILLIQVWLTICSFLSGAQLGRTNDFETSNYFLIMAVIYYICAALISHVWHTYRALLTNILLVCFAASAIVGFFQFLKVGPFLWLAQIYNRNNDITAWGATQFNADGFAAGSVRAIGLGAWPEWLAFHCLGGWAILASRLMERRLKPWEFVLASFFLLVALMAQSRIMYVSLGICGIIFLIMLIQRDKERGPVYLIAFFLSICVLAIFGGERLSYAFSTNLGEDKTLKYRSEIGWQQAFRIESERPWVGIGPDNGLVWGVTEIVPDKWTQGQYLDNGLLLLISWGGYPAVALFLPIMITGLLSTLLVLKNRSNTMERRKVAFVTFTFLMLLGNNMLLNNGFTNIWLNCLVAAFGGMCLPNSSELKSEMTQQYNVFSRMKQRALVRSELDQL